MMNGDEGTEKSDKGEMQSHEFETICWGCGLRLLLPSFIPVFKCGWCGAITSHNTYVRGHQRCQNCSRVADRVLVVTVIFLIVVIICGGIWAVFPILFPEVNLWFILHSVFTTILVFNTLYNYCMAAFVPAGPPPQIPWGNFETVGRGALEEHRFCDFCKNPKPPRAHHCRSCKACVLEMDHHCPFIGNCVGAANQRSFILFLIFAVISNIYVLVMSIYTVMKIWPTLVVFPTDSTLTSVGWHIRGVIVAFAEILLGSSFSFSLRAISLLYLVVASLSITIGVGLLLYQQLQLLYSGQTYLDSLQLQNNGIFNGLPTSRGWKNLRRIFRSEYSLFGVFPKLLFTDKSEKKVHYK